MRSKGTGMCSRRSLQATGSTISSKSGHTTGSEALTVSTPPSEAPGLPSNKSATPTVLLCPPHASPPRLPPTKTSATLAHLPACCPHWYSDPRGPNPEPSPERSQLRAASQLRTRSSQVSAQGQHRAAQMSQAAARGSSQAVSHAARPPSPPHSQRPPVRDLCLDPSGDGLLTITPQVPQLSLL